MPDIIRPQRGLLESLCNGLQNSRAGEVEQPIVLPDTFLKAVLDAQDSIPERQRVGTAGYMHVSSLIGLCTRMHCLAARNEQTLLRPVTGGHRVMWKIGRAVESHVRDQFIAGMPSVVFGKWRCKCHASEHVGHYPAQTRCPVCNGKVNEYQEYTLFDHEARIVGNPDLLLRHNGRMVVVEIKSMVAKQWEALTAPLGDHIFQAVFYQHLLQRNRFVTHPEVVLLYTTKDFKYGSPYKEFHIDATSPQNVAMIEAATEQALEIRRCMESGTIPARTVCASIDATRAKNCPVLVSCFS